MSAITVSLAPVGHLNFTVSAPTLDGWSVRSEGGEQLYSFPDGTELEGGGGRLTVWSGAKNRGAPNRRGRSPGQHLWWTARYIWNDGAQTLGPMTGRRCAGA